MPIVDDDFVDDLYSEDFDRMFVDIDVNSCDNVNNVNENSDHDCLESKRERQTDNGLGHESRKRQKIGHIVFLNRRPFCTNRYCTVTTFADKSNTTTNLFLHWGHSQTMLKWSHANQTNNI